MIFDRGATNLITELMDRKSACESALECFDLAADRLELSSEIRSLLRRPEREAWISVPITLADGRMERFEGCSIEHSTSRGPAKGGICCRADITLDEIKAQAMSMTWTWGLMDLPLGGGKGGIAVNPKVLAPAELGRLLGDPLAVAPPAGLESALPSSVEATREAPGRGVFYACAAACEHLRIPMEQARAVIQGFGDTGSTAALLLAQARVKITGASDTRGGIHNANGLDIAGLIRHKERSGSVVGFPGAEPIADFELLAAECDLLIASAARGSIHSRNAPTVRARVLAEASEGVVTASGDSVLGVADVFVVPGRLCGAARPAAGYFEWERGRQGVSGEPDKANRRLESAMRRAFQDVLAMSLERGVSMRRAADMVGIQRVAESLGPEPSLAGRSGETNFN